MSERHSVNVETHALTKDVSYGALLHEALFYETISERIISQRLAMLHADYVPQ